MANASWGRWKDKDSFAQDVGSMTSDDYNKFPEETGIEYIGFYGNWAYFSKKIADGEFELFSDIDSKVKHLKRIFRHNLLISTH